MVKMFRINWKLTLSANGSLQRNVTRKVRDSIALSNVRGHEASEQSTIY
jgi:hypothetical protein